MPLAVDHLVLRTRSVDVPFGQCSLLDPKTGLPTAYTEHEYSDRLLEFLLRGELHDKYAERKKVETTNFDGGEVPERVQELLDDPGRMAAELKADETHLP